MSDTEMWSLIVGSLAPVLISVVQQPRWSARVRALVTAVSSVVLGGGTAYFNDAFTGRTTTSSILLVAVAAFTTYRNFWKPTGVAPSIENATSPASSGRVSADNGLAP